LASKFDRDMCKAIFWNITYFFKAELFELQAEAIFLCCYRMNAGPCTC
jgi:hypothetical protein